jgi:hypothetical protein
MLDKSVLLQITIFCRCIGLIFVSQIQLRFVMNHIIECRLSQIELFGLIFHGLDDLLNFLFEVI